MVVYSSPVAQLYLRLVLLFIFLPGGSFLPCGGNLNVNKIVHSEIAGGGWVDDGEGADLVHGVPRSSLGCTGLLGACSLSDSFCFLSTLPVSAYEEDDCKGVPLMKGLGSESVTDKADIESGILHGHGRVYELSSGKTVSCASGIGGHVKKDVLASSTKAQLGRNIAGQCEGCMPPDSWLQESSAMLLVNVSDAKSSANGLSLTEYVDIHPSLLDWGVKHLYSPSFAYLTVTNTHNGTRLYVSRPYSSDGQFYPHDIDELYLAPGEATTIKFVFLPRRLGSLSAHVVLQTSFGRFILNAQGIAVDSPFRVQSMTGLSISRNGLVTKCLSLYNPYDDVFVIEEVIVWHFLTSGNQSGKHSRASCKLISSIQSSSDDFKCLNTPLQETWNEHDKVSVEIKPLGKWEVLPHESSAIIDLSMVAYEEGNVTGVICMHLKHLLSGNDKIEAIIVPLEVKVHQAVGYHITVGLISVFVDHLILPEFGNSVLAMFLASEASEPLSVLKITENSEGGKLFGIKYAKGLILYPGSLTQIATLVCPSLSGSRVSLNVNSICNLHLSTNDSSTPNIEVTCQDLLNVCSRKTVESQFSGMAGSHIGLELLPENSAESTSASPETTNDGKLLLKSKFLGTLVASNSVLRNWKSQGEVSRDLVLKEKELTFHKIEVGHHCSKWISVNNPSGKSVIMQLILNSEPMIHHCRSADNVLQHPVSCTSHLKSMADLDGFFLPKSAITEAFVPPFGSATLGPIVFYPSDLCTWSSSALIKNNLSGVEWLPIRGTSASNFMVLLEDSRPNWSTPQGISSVGAKFLEANTRFACENLSAKEFCVKNVCKLPIEEVKIQVSGSCQLDGFTVYTCKGFTLPPGNSMRLFIPHQQDFFVSAICQDLEISLPSGTIVVPLKASIPDSMTNLFRRSIISSFLRMIMSLVFIGLSLAALRLIISHVVIGLSSDIAVEGNAIVTINKVGKAARIHRNQKASRFANLELKSEMLIIRRYSDDQDGSHTVTAPVQSKQDADGFEGDLTIPACTELKSKEDQGSCSLDSPNPSNLFIKTGREKGRRRKRRMSGVGVGLSPKLEGCSSQSGNSTPSSPLSPIPFNLKQALPLSPDSNKAQKAEKKVCTSSLQGEKHTKIAKCHDTPRRASTDEQIVVPQRATAKPILTPSATFPRMGCRHTSGGVATPIFLDTASPIVAPYARAPGSNLGKYKVVERADEPDLSKEFTYDIWGDHLSEHIMGRSKEHLPQAFAKTSEGDSLSFFARGPRTLMMMPSTRLVSTDLKSPSYDVSHNPPFV